MGNLNYKEFKVGADDFPWDSILTRGSHAKKREWSFRPLAALAPWRVLAKLENTLFPKPHGEEDGNSLSNV